MKQTTLILRAFACATLVVAAQIVFTPDLRADDPGGPLPAKTALDDYVNKPDASYSWKLAKQVSGEGFTAYLVDMTSQTWRTPQEVDRPLWQHWLVVIKPDEVAFDTGFLFIGGGRNGREPPNPVDEMMVRIALASRSVTAHLKMVPNQPLVFNGDGQKRVEDDLIAYTWDQFLKTGDPTWPARNPMVKSAVRAMDTVAALMASDEGGKLKVGNFVVAGGSKRGWTTWLTGAVDDRVTAIVPIVIDVLNTDQSIRHHWAVYGFWAPAIHDYEVHHILERLDAPEVEKLYRLVDPYYYRHRLTMPKYIVTASGDQFFPPDASQFYFDDLEGEKYLRVVPNADHSLDDTDALESIVAYYRLVLSGKPRPKFSWTFGGEGTVRVRAEDLPVRAVLWQATNPEARDFRMETLGPKYTSTELEGRDGVYTANVPEPPKGWTAYFVELTYRVGELALKFTTPARVVPDTKPFADKEIPAIQ
jgi:PhoPQ-activated pathogenicity-related protein